MVHSLINENFHKRNLIKTKMEIENKLKVDRDSAPFKWVKSMVITVGAYVLTPDKREDEINALMMLTCFHLIKYLKNIWYFMYYYF